MPYTKNCNRKYSRKHEQRVPKPHNLDLDVCSFASAFPTCSTLAPSFSNTFRAKYPNVLNISTCTLAFSELACLRAYRAAMPCEMTDN